MNSTLQYAHCFDICLVHRMHPLLYLVKYFMAQEANDNPVSFSVHLGCWPASLAIDFCSSLASRGLPRVHPPWNGTNGSALRFESSSKPHPICPSKESTSKHGRGQNWFCRIQCHSLPPSISFELRACYCSFPPPWRLFATSPCPQIWVCSVTSPHLCSSTSRAQ